MTEHLPALASANVPAPLGDRHLIPALMAVLGEQASWRYVEFFTANIRNANTRISYARACCRFLAWLEERGLTLDYIRPHNVVSYTEVLPSFIPRWARKLRTTMSMSRDTETVQRVVVTSGMRSRRNKGRYHT